MKKFALTLIAAGLLAGNVSAATLVNHGDPLSVTVGSSVNTGSPFTFEFLYVGGLVTFFLDSVSPTRNLQPVSYVLTKDEDLSFSQSFSLDTIMSTALPDVFKLSLAGGNYNLNITTNAATTSSTTEISAVPLPAAALLFASSLFGAGALRRKKQQETAEMVAA
jgi:hypothetical protein